MLVKTDILADDDPLRRFFEVYVFEHEGRVTLALGARDPEEKERMRVYTLDRPDWHRLIAAIEIGLLMSAT